MNEPVAPYPVIASSRIAFTGHRPEFRRLLIRGALLELVTVGFYRFWLDDRHTAALVVEHVGRGRRAGIYRHGQGAADRLPVRLGHSRPDLCHLFHRRPRSGAGEGVREHSAHSLLLSLRPIRDLSRAPLSADTHGLARRALLDGGLRHGLCLAGGSVEPARRDQPRLCAALAAGRARSASRCVTRPTAICPAASTAPARSCSSAAGGCGSWRWWQSLPSPPPRQHPKTIFFALLFLIAGPIHVCGLQGHRMAVVGVRHSLRRRAFRIGHDRGALIGLYWTGGGLVRAAPCRIDDVVRRRGRYRVWIERV